jgi:hypothetical protein
MSNPGPASTVTPVYLFNGNAADGVALGVAGGKIGFYGETPVVQASAITTLAATPTTAETVAAVNAIIAALSGVGITA